MHIAGIAQEDEQLTWRNQFAVPYEDSSDLPGKRGHDLGLADKGLGAGQLRIRGDDASLGDGDIFGRCAFFESAQVRLGACQRGLGGLHACFGRRSLAFGHRDA